MAMPAWVSEIGVAAQVGIAIAAIWGERIRARLSRPSLRLALVDNVGARETARTFGHEEIIWHVTTVSE